MIANFKYKIGNVADFSESELASFKNIVIEAGEVAEESFDKLIAKNPTLLFIPNTTNIEAVGALKKPSNTHKQDVFAKSKTIEAPNDFKFELGWVVSLKPGNGKKLVEILSSIAPNIYSTVRKENKVMKHLLEKFEFIKSGNCYKSDRGNYELELYIKKQESS